MKTLIKVAAALVAFQCAAQAQVEETQTETVKPPPVEMSGANLSKIQKLYGIMREAASGTAEMVTQVWYERPENFAAIMTAPANLAGAKSFYDGKIFRLIIPRTEFALVLRNLPVTPSLIKSTFLDPGMSYQATVSDGDPKARRRYKAVQLKPTGSLISEASFQIDEEFSFPSKVAYQFVPSASYTRDYLQLDFNQALGQRKPIMFIPAGVVPWEFDLSSGNVPKKAFEEELKMAFQAPNELGEFKVKKVIRTKHDRAAYGALYQHADGRYIFMIFMNKAIPFGHPENLGFEVSPPEGHKGKLVMGPFLNAYTFVNQDARYFMVGNVPAAELLQASFGIRPQVAQPPPPPPKGSAPEDAKAPAGPQAPSQGTSAPKK